jgi:hypothetical protein
MKRLLLLLLIMGAAGRGESADLRFYTPRELFFPVFYSLEDGATIAGAEINGPA